MPHPIFDVSPFAIDRPEARTLTTVLLANDSTWVQIDLLDPQVANDLDSLSPGWDSGRGRPDRSGAGGIP